MSLDDIWDEPLLEAVNHPRTSVGPLPAKRPQTTLFDPSDSEDEAAQTKGPMDSKKTDITALFDELDDEEDLQLAPPLDLDALGREADARNAKNLPHALTPHQILPTQTQAAGDAEGSRGNDSGARAKKGKEGSLLNQKRVMPKMDEARLLGPDGFPALLREAKEFKPRGKGHELQDLDRLLKVYQFWAHKMYPKTQFADTVQRIEKLCHSKRMHSALGVWRDEAKGLIHGLRPEDLRDVDEGDDSDSEVEAENRGDSIPKETSSSAPRQVPGQLPGATSTSTVKPSNNTPNTLDEDEDMWDQLVDDMGEEPGPQAMPHPQAQTAEDDEDMWDLVREMEQEEIAKPSQQQGVPSIPKERPTNEEGWDEMYM